MEIKKLVYIFQKILNTITHINYVFKSFYTKKLIINNSRTVENCFLYKNLYIEIQQTNNDNRCAVFQDCTTLRNIIIQNTLVIGNNFFQGCINLKTVYIDKHIKCINHEAFKNCTSLKIIYIPRTIEKIENNAFYNCIKLEKIIFY